MGTRRILRHLVETLQEYCNCRNAQDYLGILHDHYRDTVEILDGHRGNNAVILWECCRETAGIL